MIPNVPEQPFNWNASMLEARKNFKPVIKDNTGSDGRREYKYPDLNGVLEAIEPALREQGFYIEQEPISDKVGIRTTICHISGTEKVKEFVPPTEFVGVNQKGIQACGSLITYLRRYHILAIFGLAAEDDDGKAAANAFGNSGNGNVVRRTVNSFPQQQNQDAYPAPESWN